MADPNHWQHVTVLLAEAIDAIVGREDGVYVDGTFGRGGHSRALLARLSPQGQVLAFDKDPEAVAVGEALAAQDARFSIHHAGFSRMAAVLAAHGLGLVDGVLLDLGISSPQIDNPSRGFSFRFDAPLDMRMDTSRGETAADFLARGSEQQIAEVIRDYGEERFALSIAKALVARRQGGQPVRTTGELSQVVAGAVKTREPGQDPATRTFQALRIHVNAELEALQEALKASIDVLQPGGMLAVISFHSLEDRIVKQFMAGHAHASVDRRAPFAPPAATRLEAVQRIRCTPQEVATNPRARSAILRVARRSGA